MITGLLWAGLFFSLTVIILTVLLASARRYIDVDDIEEGDDAEEDDDDPPVWTWATPPFPIARIGPCGEHDRYPIGDALRRMWISHLEKSWNLPDREPGATR